MITLTAKDVLPEDGARGALVGRVWLPQAQGPAVVAVRSDGVFDVSARFSTVSALCEENDPASALQSIERRAHRRSRRHSRQHAARSARPQKAVAAGAGRSAGAEGRRRHLCDLDAGARHRGARAGQSGLGGSDPQGGHAPRRRRSVEAEARLAGGNEAEAGADRPERLEPVSRSRHRSRRRGLHQGAGAVLGRDRHGRRPASEIDLEQSGAGGRARGVEQAAGSSAPRSATTSICATSRDARRCCCRRPRTTTPPAPSARCCGCSTRASRSTMSGAWMSA